jgi:hypothetical protein
MKASQGWRAARCRNGAIAITFDDGYADERDGTPDPRRVGIYATSSLRPIPDGGCMWNDIVIEAARGVNR